MLLQMKITTSCPNNAKPNVGRSDYRTSSDNELGSIIAALLKVFTKELTIS
jgi:hypothetical protein